MKFTFTNTNPRALATLRSNLLNGFRPFEGGKWKTVKAKIGETEVDVIEVKDGNPIWLNDDNTESQYSGDAIRRLNAENKTLRESKETAEAKVATFGDLDPAAARDAFDKLSKIDQKKLIDSGEVDRVKADIAKQYEDQIAEANAKAESANKRADDQLLTTAFVGSGSREGGFIKDKLVLPADIVQKTFGDKFKIEDGKVVAYDAAGNKLLSKVKKGEYAEFDEALSILVDGYGSKDAILRGGNQSGSGNNGGGGGGKPGQAIYRRAEYDKLPPAEQARIGQESAKGNAKIVD